MVMDALRAGRQEAGRTASRRHRARSSDTYTTETRVGPLTCHDRRSARQGLPSRAVPEPAAHRPRLCRPGCRRVRPHAGSRPGVVTDDTKTYLYLDPGRYVRQAVSLWTPSVGMGTVTHENIGYLLPMGPFYWALAELHVPLWVAQRLWMGCLLFAAGAGALYLCRVIGLRGPGRYVTALGFMYTPYVLQYAGRISVILMPWAGLPWMVAFVILAIRRGGWRYPALFALVVALVSGINASSIIYVGIAPVLWLPYAVVVAARGHLAPGVGGGLADRAALRPRLAVVGRRPPDRGGLRGQRPQVHGDGAGHLERLAGLRDPPRPRLLVLLRRRPGGALDPEHGGLHPEHRPHPGQLPPARPLLRRRRLLPVALPVVLRPRHGGRDGARRRAQPLYEPHGRRLAHQGRSWSTPRPALPCAPPTGHRRW